MPRLLSPVQASQSSPADPVMWGPGKAGTDNELPRRAGADDLGTGDGGQDDGGQGALCVDLGPEDGPTWQRFAKTVANEPDVEAVASAAQQWRLAVTPYRRLPAVDCSGANLSADSSSGASYSVDDCAVAGRRSAASNRQAGNDPASVAGAEVVAGAVVSSASVAGAVVSSASVAGAVVIDLTSIWAGPLCTQLLARAGAQVTKITCAKRPDGLSESPMYQPLNSAKQTVELDLDLLEDRCQFDQLLGTADLLVTSLSPRALANFGLVPSELSRHAPKLRMLAITAFAQNSPESDWVAYGTGVHAASGLGYLPNSPGTASPDSNTHTWPRVPAYSYPDPLAGLLACSVATDLLATDPPTATDCPTATGPVLQYRRVSLAEAIQPLVRLAQKGQAQAPQAA